MVQNANEERADRELCLRADSAREDGHLAQALVWMKRYQATGNDSPIGRLLRASLLIDLNRYGEAQALLLPLVEVRHPEIQQLALVMLIGLEESRWCLLDAERWSRMHLSVTPEQTPGYVFLGSNLSLQGRFTEACQVLLAGVTKQGDPEEVLLNLALIARAHSQFHLSRIYLQKALAITPEYSKAREVFSDVEAATGLSKEITKGQLAASSCERMLRGFTRVNRRKIRKQRSKTPPDLSSIHEQQDWSQEIEELINTDRVAELLVYLDAVAPRFSLRRADLMMDFCRFDEAAASLRLAMRTPSGRDEHIAHRWARWHTKQGQHEQAEGWFRKWLSAPGDRASALMEIGRHFYRCGSLDRALQLFHTLCEESPRRSDGFFLAGKVHLARENFHKAAACFSRATELDPEDEQASEALMDVSTALRLGVPDV